MGEPRVVDAGRGAAWWSEGFRLFRSNVFTWIGIMIIYIVITFLVNIVPYVGSIGHWLLTPVFVGGLMLGCRSIERDGTLRVAHLFEGFQGAHFVQLMIIGAVNIALTLAIAAIMAAGVFGGVHMADMMQFGAGGDPLAALRGSMGAIGGTGLLALLAVLVIGTVFAMLNWFAPALVALRGLTAVAAMKTSFLSCLRNWLPFLVYALVAIAIAVAALLATGGLALLFGATGLFDSSAGLSAMIGFMFVVMALFLVVGLAVGPIVFGSTYAGFKDTLAGDSASPGQRPA